MSAFRGKADNERGWLFWNCLWPDRTAAYGQVVDAWQLTIADVGPSSVDQGKGAKLLFAPPGLCACHGLTVLPAILGNPAIFEISPCDIQATEKLICLGNQVAVVQGGDVGRPQSERVRQRGR
jgi:hypothetical protein